MQRPIPLSDSALDTIFRTAAPIDVDQRDEFLRAVYTELVNHHGEIGDGVVYAACRTVQKQFFRPPPGPWDHRQSRAAPW